MLKTTPNDILCFPEGEDRQAFIGLLEGMGPARGLPPGQAALLAETVAAKLDSPAIRNGGISPRDTARILALEAIHQILPKERL